jgi:hypothetical protein
VFHEALPEVVILDERIVSYSDLPCAGNPAVERDLRRYGREPRLQCFRLIRLPTDMFYALKTSAEDVAFYERLAEEDAQDARQRLGIIDGYRRQLREGSRLEPVVVTTDLGWLQILDGHHRIAAAWAENAPCVEAWELLDKGPTRAGANSQRAEIEEHLRRFRVAQASQPARPKRGEMTEADREKARRLLLGEE